MRRVRGYHLVFALTLLALAALGTWWTLFISRSVDLERRHALSELRYQAVVTALALGHREAPPQAEDLPDRSRLEFVPCEAPVSEGTVPVMPLHASTCIRPTAGALHAVDAKLRSRQHMVAGESSFLFLLLGVCTIMLFRLVRQERRHLARMETFVHAVTHEMKTPLAGIKSLLETMQAGRVPEAARGRLLALGLEQAERLEHSIENVLIAGALRAGQQRVQVMPVLLAGQLEGFIEHRRRSLPHRPEAVQLRWELPPDGLLVDADPDMLRVVLENLVDNGFKYGGEDPVVQLQVRFAEATVQIAVSDGGIGFEPGHVEQLFVPFRRGLPGGHGVLHGTGLGLSIARTLCRRMKGELTASSAGPGQGATFTISLPASTREVVE